MVGNTGNGIQSLPELDIPFESAHILLSQDESACAAASTVVCALVTI